MIYKQKQLKVLNLAPTSLCSSEFPSVDCEQITTASTFASLGCRRSAANYRRWWRALTRRHLFSFPRDSGSSRFVQFTLGCVKISSAFRLDVMQVMNKSWRICCLEPRKEPTPALTACPTRVIAGGFLTGTKNKCVITHKETKTRLRTRPG